MCNCAMMCNRVILRVTPLLVALIMLHLARPGVGDENPLSLEVMISRLESGDSAIQGEVIREITQNRERAIHAIMIAAKLERDNTRYEEIAIRGRLFELLGKYRASEASQLLVENIELTHGLRTSNPLHDFPAARALVAIGSPAIPWILGALEVEPISDQQAKLFAEVLRRIDGDSAIVKFRLERGQKSLEERLRSTTARKVIQYAENAERINKLLLNRG
jgi:hypothetical protein